MGAAPFARTLLDRVVAASGTTTVSGFNRWSGERTYRNNVIRANHAPPVIDPDGSVHMFTNNSLKEFNYQNGIESWEIHLGDYQSMQTMAMKTWPISDGTTLWVISYNPQPVLWALNTHDQSVIWKRSGAFFGAPALADGLIYVYEDSAIVAYDSTTGEHVFTYNGADQGPSYQPIVGENVLFAGGGQVYKLGLDHVAATLPAGHYAALGDRVIISAGGSLQAWRFPQAQGNKAPVIAANVGPISGDAPLAVTVDATGTLDPDGDPMTYLWDYGDGTTSTSISGGHTYEAGGTYTLTLIVRDDRGGLSTSRWSIAVKSEPVAEDLALSTRKNTPISGTLPGTDPDGDLLTFQIVSSPTHGVLTGLLPDFTYRPDTGYLGTDTFIYEVSDGRTTAQGTVTITMVPFSREPGAEWPTGGNTIGRSGRQTISVSDPSGLTPLWQITLQSKARDTRIVDDVAIVVDALTTGNTWMRAYDLTTGIERWEATFNTGATWIENPSFKDGFGYVMMGFTNEKALVCFDVGNGQEVWRQSISGTSSSQYNELIISEDRIIGVSESSHILHAWDRSDGSLLWTSPGIIASDCVPAANKYHVMVCRGGNFHTINLSDGSIDWSLQLRDLVYSGATVTANERYAFTYFYHWGKYHLYAIDLTTQQLAWQKELDDEITALNLAGDHLFVSSGAALVTFRTADGVSVDTYNVANPVLTSGHLFGVGSGQQIYRIDDPSFPINETFEGDPVIVDGFLIGQVGTSLYGYALPTASTNRPPIARSQTSLNSGEAPLTVRFDGRASTDADEDELIHSWRIDADRRLTGSVVRHTFTEPGRHVVRHGVRDGHGGYHWKWHEIKVESIPVAEEQTLLVHYDRSRDIKLLGSDADGDPVTFQVESFPQHGLLTGSGQNWTYTPNLGYVGVDSFTFSVSDGTNTSEAALVFLNVTHPADGNGRHWPTFGGSSTRTHTKTADLNTAGTPLTLWHGETSYYQDWVASDGIMVGIYVPNGGRERSVQARDIETGAIMWTHDVDGTPSQATIHNGYVYFTTREELHGVALTDGRYVIRTTMPSLHSLEGRSPLVTGRSYPCAWENNTAAGGPKLFRFDRFQGTYLGSSPAAVGNGHQPSPCSGRIR